VLKTVLKKPSREHIPHLRGHKNRDDNYFNRNLGKDQEVQFIDTLGPADIYILDMPIGESLKKAPKDV